MIALGVKETYAYFLIWSGGVTASLYNLFLVGKEFDHAGHDVHHFEDFTPGWFNRYRDISDFEWNCWTLLFVRLLPWLFLNFIGAEVIKLYFRDKHILPLWYAYITLSATTCLLNFYTAIVLLLIVCTFYISVFPHIAFVWLFGFLCRRYVPTEALGKTEQDIYLVEVASSWLVLRCLAYCMESSRSKRTSLPVLLGYSLYLPTMFCGPLLSFPSFHRGLLHPYRMWTKSRCYEIIRSFIRCIFWYLFTMVALHFIYVNAILLRPNIIARMSVWQMAGLGIAMGHFFHLKYLVFYGVPCAWASAEGLATPRPPCCVSRVYLYSVMWRYFDHGLYSFLVRYIYIPILKVLRNLNKLVSRTIASVICFVFVYIWHGEGEYVRYWVLLNFAAVTVEAAAREVYLKKPIKRWAENTFCAANRRRLHCLLAAPLHYFSMLSNYFFIGSLEVGSIYFIRARLEPFWNTIYILFFLYGAAQTAVTIELKEKRKR